MKVKLQINIGYPDQVRLELSSGSEGDVLDVPEPVTKLFKAKAWAVDTDEPTNEEKKAAEKKAAEKKAAEKKPAEKNEGGK